MPSQWPIAGGPLMARRCVLAEMETLMTLGRLKIRQYFVSKWFVNLHLTFIFIVVMYIHLVDVNIQVGFSFFSAFLDLQSIRDDETTTSKKLIFFNALTDVPII